MSRSATGESRRGSHTVLTLTSCLLTLVTATGAALKYSNPEEPGDTITGTPKRNIPAAALSYKNKWVKTR
jgi:hypothetical protein